MNIYDKGDVVRVSGAFTNLASAAIDPDVVLFAFRRPDNTGAIYTYGTDAQLVKDSTGNYHVDLDADQVGTYYYRMYSTGTGKAAEESSFLVESKF